jgi:hypothetical protein
MKPLFAAVLFFTTFNVYPQIIDGKVEISDSSLKIENNNKANSNEEYSIQQLKDKLAGYTKMHKNGQMLMSIGIPLTALGLIGYISGIAALANHNEGTGATLLLVGDIGIAIGPEMAVAGIVLNRIGGNKQKEYEKRLGINISLNSIELKYNF